jgi:hypothetical protein
MPQNKDVTPVAPLVLGGSMASHKTYISPLYQTNASTSTIQIVWRALPCQPRDDTIF